MKNKLHELYLDWVNNFLTVNRFAEYYNFSIERANRIINLGRKLNNRNDQKKFCFPGQHQWLIWHCAKCPATKDTN